MSTTWIYFVIHVILTAVEGCSGISKRIHATTYVYHLDLFCYTCHPYRCRRLLWYKQMHTRNNVCLPPGFICYTCHPYRCRRLLWYKQMHTRNNVCLPPGFILLYVSSLPLSKGCSGISKCIHATTYVYHLDLFCYTCHPYRCRRLLWYKQMHTRNNVCLPPGFIMLYMSSLPLSKVALV